MLVACCLYIKFFVNMARLIHECDFVKLTVVRSFDAILHSNEYSAQSRYFSLHKTL